MGKNKLARVLCGVLAACAVAAVAGHGQTLAESSAETRFQLDCHVPDAALQALLPAGFSSSVAAKGPAKDANLRVVFIDRITVTGPDGKAAGTGSSQLVYLVASVKDANGADAQLVIGGMSDNQADAAGPFGVYLPASTHTMRRSVSSGTGPVIESQDWEFAAPSGEHLEMHIRFERGVGFKIGPSEVKFYSAKNPSFYQISKEEERLDILRNVTITPPDRVKEFSFKAAGGSYAKLFDGKEKLLSWDNILWMNRLVMLP